VCVYINKHIFITVCVYINKHVGQVRLFPVLIYNKQIDAQEIDALARRPEPVLQRRFRSESLWAHTQRKEKVFFI